MVMDADILEDVDADEPALSSDEIDELLGELEGSA